MGVLQDVIALRQQELADVQAIPQALGNLIALQRQSEVDELNRLNILSQIETREKEDVFDQIRKVNEGLNFANATRNIDLKNRLVEAGNQLLTGQEADVDSLLGEATIGIAKQDVDVNRLLTQPSIIDQTIGEIDPFTGKPTERAKLAIKKEEAEIEVRKQAGGQRAKAAELAERDITRAFAAVDTAFDEVLSFSEEQFRKFGVKPGQFIGIFDKLTPKQFNRFKAAANGAGRESAALIARQIIPGVRAANITKIFAQSSAEVGNTLEGNAENVSASMGTAFANALGTNIDVVNEAGETVRIQDVTIDPKTGRPLSQLTFTEKTRAINDIKRDFRRRLADDYIMRVFRRNPDLLQPETQKEILGKLSDEELQEIMASLRGR